MICGVLNRSPALAPGGIATDVILDEGRTSTEN
jgi:hypothetical protein